MANRHAAWLLPAAFLLFLSACGGGDDNNDTTTNTSVPVSREASQQGTSGGVADYDGDGVDDLFVGAPYAGAGSRIGAVLVFRGGANGFEAAPTWTLTGDDNFGFKFANVGDVDGDGTSDFAVTALNGDGPAASLCGSVTVYRGGSGGQVLAKLAGEQALDKFGYSLTGGCDLNADGHVDLVVGAISHSPGPDRYLGGAVYVYFGPNLAEASRVKIPASTHAGILGFSSACGDVNADNVDDLVLSAMWTHGVIWHDSQVLVYHGGAKFYPATDSSDLTIVLPRTSPYDNSSLHLGEGLSVLNDINGDSCNEIAIGNPIFYGGRTPAPIDAGAVYVVTGCPSTQNVNLRTPQQGDLLTTIYGEMGLERFGSVVTGLNDFDADGLPDFAVSALHANAEGATELSNGLLAGRVYVFSGKDLATDGTETSHTRAKVLSRTERDLHYGSFLARFERSGPKLLVGAPTADRLTGAVFREDLPTDPQ